MCRQWLTCILPSPSINPTQNCSIYSGCRALSPLVAAVTPSAPSPPLLTIDLRGDGRSAGGMCVEVTHKADVMVKRSKPVSCKATSRLALASTTPVTKKIFLKKTKKMKDLEIYFDV